MSVLSQFLHAFVALEIRSTDELKADIEHIIIHKNQMSKYFFDDSLKVKDEYEGLSKDGKTKINKKVREGYSICKTCVSYLKKAKCHLCVPKTNWNHQSFLIV